MELRTDRFKLKDVFPDRAGKYAQRLHVKADELDYVRKAIPINPEETEIREGERAAVRLVTTPRLDRDEEILLPDGAVLDDFRASPSVLFGHDYGSLPIGKDEWIKVTKKGILAKTIYAQHQFAEDVFQCVKGGFLNSNSVGFIPVSKVTPDDKLFGTLVDLLEKDYGVPRDEAQRARNIYTKWIMLEHSDVPIASNSQSLNLAVSKNELVIQSPLLKSELGIEPEPMPEPSPEISADVVTKPETTDNYHRIPVSDGHDGHEIRTITVSASEGIKALYCTQDKVIVTYLFDVDKWSMEEARAWVEEHKKDVIGALIKCNDSDDWVVLTPKTKDADPTPPVAAPDYLEILARLDELARKIDAMAKPPESTPVPAPEGVIELDPEDMIEIEAEPEIVIEDAPTIAPVRATAPPIRKAAQALTEDNIEQAVAEAIAKLDIAEILKEGISLSLDKLRGKVR